MDIAGLAMSMSQINIQTQYGMAMLSKSLDVSQQMGDSFVEMMDRSMMEQSVNPHIGGNIDFSV